MAATWCSLWVDSSSKRGAMYNEQSTLIGFRCTHARSTHSALDRSCAGEWLPVAVGADASPTVWSRQRSAEQMRRRRTTIHRLRLSSERYALRSGRTGVSRPVAERFAVLETLRVPLMEAPPPFSHRIVQEFPTIKRD